jgi:SAM-dependent methyltransferase
MSDATPVIANTQQEQFWNDVAGPLWVAAEQETERQTAPFGEAALARAAPLSGETVLDVGCGCGVTTAALAEAVGVTGQVVGVDLSAPMLARAAERIAARPGVGKVEFRRADAQVADLGSGAFDLLFSRFGVMFFADPIAGFGNLRQAMAPAGRLVFSCWQTPSANPWMAVVNRGAAEIYGLEAPPHDAPGPFSLADRARLIRILETAGFAEVDVHPHEVVLPLGAGRPVTDWVHERLLMGPARSLYLEESPARQEAVRRLLAARLEPYRVDAADPLSGLALPAAAWIVAAT